MKHIIHLFEVVGSLTAIFSLKTLAAASKYFGFYFWKFGADTFKTIGYLEFGIINFMVLHFYFIF